MNEKATYDGPLAPSLSGSLFKLLGSLIGGSLGAGILILIFTLASSFFEPVLAQETGDTIAPIVLFIFMGMIFLASLGANLVGVLLMGFAEREKYTRISLTVMQIFILHLVIFMGMAPIYLIITNISVDIIAAIAVTQIIMSVIASIIILEVVSNAQYGLVGVYTAVFGTILGLMGNFFLFQITGKTSLLLFTAFPLLWFSIGLVSVGAHALYYKLWQIYGVDFLNPADETFEEEEPQEEEITEEEVMDAREDKEGGDFLKKN